MPRRLKQGSIGTNQKPVNAFIPWVLIVYFYGVKHPIAKGLPPNGGYVGTELNRQPAAFIICDVRNDIGVEARTKCAGTNVLQALGQLWDSECFTLAERRWPKLTQRCWEADVLDCGRREGGCAHPLNAFWYHKACALCGRIGQELTAVSRVEHPIANARQHSHVRLNKLGETRCA